MLTFSSPDGSALLLQTKNTSLLFFPSDDGQKADLLLRSTPEETPAAGTLSWPGEYDIGGIAIRGIGQREGEHVSYVIEAEGIRCAFLAAPLEEWTDHDIELLGDVAVLAVQGDDMKKAQKLLEDVDPRVIIPLQAEGAAFSELLKVCGGQGVEPEKEFKLKGVSQLPQEGRSVVVLA